MVSTRDIFDIAADLDTPVSAFLKLRSLNPRFLLESVEGGERLARYSFLGFGEGLDFRLDSTGLTIDGKPLPHPSSQDELLAALRAALEVAPRPGPIADGVPFTGGLVGASSFELMRTFEPASGRASLNGLPLALYTAPRSVLVFDHLTRRAALLHDGSESERASLRAEVIQALRGSIPQETQARSHQPPRPTMERGAFMDGVQRTKDRIGQGDIYQLVLSVGFSGECEVDPFQVYRALRLINPSPYLFYCQHGDDALVGSSPEALVRLTGRKGLLRPIAGTRPRGGDVEEDDRLARELKADPKEIAEHMMLVDLARNDLGRLAVPGSVVVEPKQIIERYSHVMHMVSGVEGTLAPGFDAFDLFAAAFPAGTVVGAPKIRAAQLIEELEPAQRGFYAGTVGYFGNSGAMDQAIAIRTIAFGPGRYRYQAGAGIVADSRPDKEHDEVLAKSAVLESSLTLAETAL